MTSPIKRVAPRRTAAPIDLMASPPAAPAVGPEMVTEEEAAAIVADLMNASEAVPDAEPAASDAPDEFSVHATQAEALAAAGFDVPDVTGETVELTRAEYLLASMLENIAARQETLVNAVRIIGEQQQWLTDNAAKTFEQFQTVMGGSGGSPLKAIMGMLGGGLNPKSGKGQ